MKLIFIMCGIESWLCRCRVGELVELRKDECESVGGAEDVNIHEAGASLHCVVKSGLRPLHGRSSNKNTACGS
jgi:hypothetical protein